MICRHGIVNTSLAKTLKDCINNEVVTPSSQIIVRESGPALAMHRRRLCCGDVRGELLRVDGTSLNAHSASPGLRGLLRMADQQAETRPLLFALA